MPRTYTTIQTEVKEKFQSGIRWWCRKCHYSATVCGDLRRHYREWHAEDLTTDEVHFAEATYQQSHHVTQGGP